MNKKIPENYKKSLAWKKVITGQKNLITSSDLFLVVLGKLVNSLPSKT